MNPQERDQLTLLLNQLSDAKLAGKDQEAEALIKEAVTRQPDAAYLLIQRTLLMEQALNVAKAQIAQLQAQVAQAGSKSSFLGGGNPWAQPLESVPAGVPGAGNYQIPRTAPAAAGAAPAPAFGGGGSSFLGNVATTAAGVVAGSFLFQGLESLLGGHHQSGFGGFGNPSGELLSEQTIINNYYDTPPNNEVAFNDDPDQNSDMEDFLAEDDSSSSFGDSDDSDWG